MIASAIAYLISGLSVFLALYGFYSVGTGKAERAGKNENQIMNVSIVLLFVGWGCAYLGGI